MFTKSAKFQPNSHQVLTCINMFNLNQVFDYKTHIALYAVIILNTIALCTVT